ncbi:DNA-binding protein [Candidatus Enterococcus clewellii]|uniref:Helix-turn-helix domain-containing protein n=1 Tax=Candidatus Enterococcus clewellii TaxID=1834193 RepID=A0A242K7P6_9ENTE|nr:DNA-binding protein [Enterococcus sp. 9E7_DIV0242]OTP17172.1 hypothetical protein A5888_001310 [Enterococcus sp. 9E7_DIV0242]
MGMVVDVDMNELVMEIVSGVSEVIGGMSDLTNRYGEYLTTEETRIFLGGISVNTLAKLRKKGLKRITIDGLCLYKKTDIVQFLDEHTY